MAGVLVLLNALPAQEPQPEKQKRFIYVLHLVPGCTATGIGQRGQGCVAATFRSIPRSDKSGQLILAGRTKEPGEKTFGIAIFKAQPTKQPPEHLWKQIPPSRPD